MYGKGYDVSNNIYNQLSAISLLDQSKLDFNPLNYEIAMFARRFNINITGDYSALSQEELYFRIAKNDVILCIYLIDNDSLIPLQSLELGVPCIIGNGSKYFENSELEKYIKIEEPENIMEICNKISFVIENRQKIISLYQEWKKDNNK